MLRSLTSGVSAMQQFQQQMDVIGNNIANVNTTGYKQATVGFTDALSQSLQGNGAGGLSQIGTGVSTGSINSHFTQGTVSPTGVTTDAAIAGDGFFTVHDPISSTTYATRDGSFKLQNGYLVTTSGYRVQGYSDAALATIGDIAISSQDCRFATDGKITVQQADGSTAVCGQLLLQNFQNPQALTKEGDNLYSNLTAAGPLAAPVAPNTNGVGKIQGGYLESSNVDLTHQFTDMITAQRAFQASARVITTSDEMLQELVSLKR